MNTASTAKISGLRKTTAALLAALAIGSSFIAVGTAEARPGWGGHHHRHHHRHWRGAGYVGLGLGAAYIASGPRCRLVERVNAYGDVVLRRVCPRPYYY